MEKRRQLQNLRNKLKGTLVIPKEQQLSPEEIQKRKDLEQENIFYIKGGFYENFFEQMNFLGEGCHGIVYRVKRHMDGLMFACKMVKTCDDETIQNIITEFRNVRKLDHPNIVKAFELYIDEGCARVYTIMELVEGKEIFQIIQELGHYSEDLASHIFQQILQAIIYMHKNNVSHRDLKPHNILSNGKMVKITDFNVSKFQSQDKATYKIVDKIKMLTYTGTIAFSAPEIFMMGQYTEAVDVWSAGVILYCMLSGEQPFQAEYVKDLIQSIQEDEVKFEGKVWENINEEAIDLINKLLTKDPANRISVYDAILHPWITKKQNTTPLLKVISQNLELNNEKFILSKVKAYQQLGLIKRDSINFMKRSSACTSLLHTQQSSSYTQFGELSVCAETNSSVGQDYQSSIHDLDQSFVAKNRNKGTINQSSLQDLGEQQFILQPTIQFKSSNSLKMKGRKQKSTNKQIHTNILDNRYVLSEVSKFNLQLLQTQEQFNKLFEQIKEESQNSEVMQNSILNQKIYQNLAEEGNGYIQNKIDNENILGHSNIAVHIKNETKTAVSQTSTRESTPNLTANRKYEAPVIMMDYSGHIITIPKFKFVSFSKHFPVRNRFSFRAQQQQKTETELNQQNQNNQTERFAEKQRELIKLAIEGSQNENYNYNNNKIQEVDCQLNTKNEKKNSIFEMIEFIDVPDIGIQTLNRMQSDKQNSKSSEDESSKQVKSSEVGTYKSQTNGIISKQEDINIQSLKL